jgi:hypothetical protein
MPGNNLGLRFFQHQLFLDDHNLFSLHRSFFLGLSLGLGRFALQRLRLFNEMDFFLGVLGVIRHILPLGFLIVAIFKT